jgi:hypothetical protein
LFVHGGITDDAIQLVTQTYANCERCVVENTKRYVTGEISSLEKGIHDLLETRSLDVTNPKVGNHTRKLLKRWSKETGQKAKLLVVGHCPQLANHLHSAKDDVYVHGVQQAAHMNVRVFGQLIPWTKDAPPDVPRITAAWDQKKKRPCLFRIDAALSRAWCPVIRGHQSWPQALRLAINKDGQTTHHTVIHTKPIPTPMECGLATKDETTKRVLPFQGCLPAPKRGSRLDR